MNLREARLAKALSLDALAARAGVTSGQIWKLETGRVKQPSLRSKRLLAQALGRLPTASSVLFVTSGGGRCPDVSVFVVLRTARRVRTPRTRVLTACPVRGKDRSSAGAPCGAAIDQVE